MKTIKPLLLSLVLLMAACSQTPLLSGGDNQVTVSSEPSGALVYVMGEMVATTPAVIDLSVVYPVTYAQEHQGDYGRITLKHAGCEDRVITVSSSMLSSGLKTKLDCFAAEAAQITTPALADKPVAQRLEELQALRDRGMISEEEYLTIRRRILESL